MSLTSYLSKRKPSAAGELNWENHFTILDKKNKNQWSLKCNFCNHTFSGRMNRALSHLAGIRGKGVIACTNVPNMVAQEAKARLLNAEVDECEQKKFKPNTVGAHFASVVCEKALGHLARFVYTSGVSFHSLQNPHFKAFVSTLNSNFQIPSEYMLKGPLLDAEVRSIAEWKQAVLSEGNITLTGDGWTNVSNVSCTNMEAVTTIGAVHIKTFERKSDVLEVDAAYVAELFNSTIASLGGVDAVAGIVTDNEAKMQNVWKLVEEKNKGIVGFGCAAHLSNLLMKDMSNLNWITTIINQTKNLAFYVKNHSFVQALFREKVFNHQDLHGKNIQVPCKTRFGTYFLMLERTLVLKTPFKELFIDSNFENSPIFNRDFQKLVLSEAYWEHLLDCIQVMQPVYAFLRYCDGPSAQMGLIFEKVRAVGDEIKSSGSTMAAAAHDLFLERLDGTSRKVAFHHAVHTAAMMLHPHNWNLDFQAKYGENYAAMRIDFMDILLKVSKTGNDADKALAQYDDAYRRKTVGLFRMEMCQTAALKLSPVVWWSSNGVQVPELQYVAVRVLSLGVSNSAAERNWSLHGFIHSKSRNRLGFDLQEKLVDVHANLKLKSKSEHDGCFEYFTDEEFGDTDSGNEEAIPDTKLNENEGEKM
jgi:hypothetical protein